MVRLRSSALCWEAKSIQTAASVLSIKIKHEDIQALWNLAVLSALIFSYFLTFGPVKVFSSSSVKQEQLLYL